jgi:hypothetical protein
MRLPDFLVIGTQKGGTTTLHQLLEKHPNLYLPTQKEIHFFSLHDGYGLDWYGRHYRDAAAQQLCGDVTPYYLFHPRAPLKIHTVLPQAKLIALLRDPVERALSQFFHARRHGFEPLELEAAIAAEQERLADAQRALETPGSQHYSHQKHSYMSRSRYEQQLNHYAKLFPAKQLLVCRSEDLFTDTTACLDRITAFLGIKAIHPDLNASIRANAGAGEAAAVPDRIRQQLRAELAPTVAAIRSRYGFNWGW